MNGVSPIAAKQRAMYGDLFPLVAMNPRRQIRQTRTPQMGRFGFLGVTGQQAAGTTLTGAKVGSAAGVGVASAIGAGAAAGSVVPLIGTAIGALVGLVASGVFNKTDPEVGTWDAAGRAWQQNRLSVLNIANKYLVLAGLFDLHPNQIKGNIPIYKKYGRMGEYAFARDMANQVYNAAQSGVIGPSDTPQSVMAKVVQPWIDSFGFGSMSDYHADMINLLLTGMVMDYIAGNAQQAWRDVNGGAPFSSLPRFALPMQAVQPEPVTPAPTQTLPVPSPAPSPTPASSGVSIPAGFTLVGQVNGVPAYQGQDGRFYQWSGTAMQLATGTLQTPSGAFAVTGGLMAASGSSAPTPTGPSSVPGYAQLDPGTLAMIQQALAQGASAQQAAQAAVNAGVPPQQAIAATQAVTAGSAGAGLPSWATYAGIGAGVLLLVFALARPAKMRTR